MKRRPSWRNLRSLRGLVRPGRKDGWGNCSGWYKPNRGPGKFRWVLRISNASAGFSFTAGRLYGRLEPVAVASKRPRAARRGDGLRDGMLSADLAQRPRQGGGMPQARRRMAAPTGGTESLPDGVGTWLFSVTAEGGDAGIEGSRIFYEHFETGVDMRPAALFDNDGLPDDLENPLDSNGNKILYWFDAADHKSESASVTADDGAIGDHAVSSSTGSRILTNPDSFQSVPFGMYKLYIRARFSGSYFTTMTTNPPSEGSGFSASSGDFKGVDVDVYTLQGTSSGSMRITVFNREIAVSDFYSYTTAKVNIGDPIFIGGQPGFSIGLPGLFNTAKLCVDIRDTSTASGSVLLDKILLVRQDCTPVPWQAKSGQYSDFTEWDSDADGISDGEEICVQRTMENGEEVIEPLLYWFDAEDMFSKTEYSRAVVELDENALNGKTMAIDASGSSQYSLQDFEYKDFPEFPAGYYMVFVRAKKTAYYGEEDTDVFLNMQGRMSTTTFNFGLPIGAGFGLEPFQMGQISDAVVGTPTVAVGTRTTYGYSDVFTHELQSNYLYFGTPEVHSATSFTPELYFDTIDPDNRGRVRIDEILIMKTKNENGLETAVDISDHLTNPFITASYNQRRSRDAPFVDITSPLDGADLDGIVTFYADARPYISHPSVYIKEMRCFIDNVDTNQRAGFSAPSSGSYTPEVTGEFVCAADNLYGTEHVVRIEAKDNLGNVNSDSIYVTTPGGSEDNPPDFVGFHLYRSLDQDSCYSYYTNYREGSDQILCMDPIKAVNSQEGTKEFTYWYKMVIVDYDESSVTRELYWRGRNTGDEWTEWAKFIDGDLDSTNTEIKFQIEQIYDEAQLKLSLIDGASNSVEPIIDARFKPAESINIHNVAITSGGETFTADSGNLPPVSGNVKFTVQYQKIADSNAHLTFDIQGGPIQHHEASVTSVSETFTTTFDTTGLYGVTIPITVTATDAYGSDTFEFSIWTEQEVIEEEEEEEEIDYPEPYVMGTNFDATTQSLETISRPVTESYGKTVEYLVENTVTFEWDLIVDYTLGDGDEPNFWVEYESYGSFDDVNYELLDGYSVGETHYESTITENMEYTLFYFLKLKYDLTYYDEAAEEEVTISGTKSSSVRLTGWHAYDADDDGIEDQDEVDLGSDPYSKDSDHDFLEDGQELNGWNSVTKVFFKETTSYLVNTDFSKVYSKANAVSSDPIKQDTDSDGLLDPLEYHAGTDPYDVDTDDDLLTDYKDIDPTVYDLDCDKDGVSNAEDNWPNADKMLKIEFLRLLVSDSEDQDFGTDADLFIAIDINDMFESDDKHSLFSDRPLKEDDNDIDYSNSDNKPTFYRNILDGGKTEFTIALFDDDVDLCYDKIDLKEGSGKSLSFAIDIGSPTFFGPPEKPSLTTSSPGKITIDEYDDYWIVSGGKHKEDNVWYTFIKFKLSLEDELTYEEKTDIAERFSPVYFFDSEENQRPVDIKYDSGAGMGMYDQHTRIYSYPYPNGIDDFGDWKDTKGDDSGDDDRPDGSIPAYRTRDLNNWNDPEFDSENHNGLINYIVFTGYNGKICVEYWTYYFYNNGVNTHTHDREGIALILSDEDDNRPDSVIYLSHYWMDVVYEKDDYDNSEYQLGFFSSSKTFHPKVYVARGGHGAFMVADSPYPGESCNGDGIIWHNDIDFNFDTEEKYEGRAIDLYDIKEITHNDRYKGVRNRCITPRHDYFKFRETWGETTYPFIDPVYTLWFEKHAGFLN